MGVEYNHLAEVCDSRKASQKEELCMGWDINFTERPSFVHEQQVERKKKSLDMEQPWRVNSTAC
jgi:hypothetical protein